jgi:predicted transcriptional regulator
MVAYSTNQAAKQLGISGAALSKYIKAGKVPAPKVVQTGWRDVHSWSDEDIEHLRKLLPKIANGRKTRYQKKKQSALSNQQSAKTKKKTSPRAAARHKPRTKKNKTKKQIPRPKPSSE